ncbi:MAG: DUF4136 domain-containing protein [Acidobacteria bacterium]|nr:DUF4136 domain-containing protein [Acidobacteriota bacterium]
MKFRSLLASALCAAALLTPALAFADHVKTDYNHQINFSTFHTYSWGKVKVSDQLDESRIKHAVDEQLQKDGWQLVPSGGQVTLMATDHIHNEQEAENYYSPMPDGWGGGWGWGGWEWGMGGGMGQGEELSTVTNTQSAHLIVDIFDAQTKHLLWRGVSRGELTDKPNVNRKHLYADIHKMFDHFPPKSK